MRIIDADELLQEIEPELTWEMLAKINALTEADAKPVVHGLWIAVDSSYWRWTPSGGVSVAHITYRCNRCGRGSITQSKYCPNCGAQMDGGDA